MKRTKALDKLKKKLGKNLEIIKPSKTAQTIHDICGKTKVKCDVDKVLGYKPMPEHPKYPTIQGSWGMAKYYGEKPIKKKKKVKRRCPGCKVLCTIEGRMTLYYLPVKESYLPKGDKDTFGKVCIICGAWLKRYRRGK